MRGQKILLDVDLAALYGVPTKRFNEQVKRNMARFPSDFMFQLDDDELAALRSQFATSNEHPVGFRCPP
ncbi:ORF6N domain-containing protein [Oxalobacteraceae bacterium]|nr:ORF6N domain-containing protein [Oxalobacteraceae bacterium]